jgi:hypothetical protein
MGQDGKRNIEGFYALAARAKLFRHFNNETMMFVCNSNGTFSAGNQTQYADVKGAFGRRAIDGMHSAIVAFEVVDLH